MADITDVVSLDIVIADSSPATPNFGRIMVLGHSIDATPGVLALYKTSAAGQTAYAAAGHTNTKGSGIRRIADRICSQVPKTSDFYVYTLPAVIGKEVELTVVNVAAGRTWSVEVNGTVCAITWTTTTLDTADEIATALAALITVVTGVDAVAVGAVIAISCATGFSNFTCRRYDPNRLQYEDTTADGSVDDVLDVAAALATDGFYGVAIEHMDALNIAAVAAWCEAHGKIFCYTTADHVNLTAATGVGDTLADSGYNYSVGVFSQDDTFAGAGLMSRQFSRNPGSSTWALKKITGVATDDYLTPTQIAALRTNNLMPYTLTRGEAFTLDGWAASGRFVDLTHFSDWLKGEVETGMLKYFLDNESVQQTVQGIQGAEGVVRSALLRGVARGGIRDDFTVTVPLLADISPSDRTGRHLTGIEFTANATGAWHDTSIEGRISTST